jgi:hypothetical protein
VVPGTGFSYSEKIEESFAESTALAMQCFVGKKDLQKEKDLYKLPEHETFTKFVGSGCLSTGVPSIYHVPQGRPST